MSPETNLSQEAQRLQEVLNTQGFLSLRAFCAYLKEVHPAASISYPTALKCVRRGQLKATQYGGTYRILADEVQRWVTGGNKFQKDYLEEIAERRRETFKDFVAMPEGFLPEDFVETNPEDF